MGQTPTDLTTEEVTAWVALLALEGKRYIHVALTDDGVLAACSRAVERGPQPRDFRTPHGGIVCQRTSGNYDCIAKGREDEMWNYDGLPVCPLCRRIARMVEGWE